MAINERDIKTWSQIGSRAHLDLLVSRLERKKNLIVLTSDVSTSVGLDDLRGNFKSVY